MKNCPKCSQKFSDETLNFCLECGSILVTQLTPNQNAATVLMSQPRETANVNQNQQRNFATVNNSPRRKSRAWLWIIGILGVFIVLIGIVFVAIALIVATIPNTEISKNKNASNQNSSIFPEKKDVKTSSNDVLKDDLSKWTYSDAAVGKSVFNDNSLEMSAIDNRHYFMLTTPDSKFRTENATTRVTITNSSNQSTELGYGILIHCDENSPGKKDYAFLIDSKSGRFRISKHKETVEVVIINWSKTSAINLGDESNEIEVKDGDGNLSFYINGQIVKSIKHSDGNDNGIVGLYTGSGFPVSFSNLEIRK